MRHRQLVVVTVVAGIVLSGAGLGVASSSYGLAVSDSFDVPDRTVSVEGEEYEVTALSAVDPGDEIEADVDMPADRRSYRVHLYNSDRQIAKTTPLQTDDATVSFGTDDLEAGSYVLVIDDGGFQAVHPIVVQGYDVTLETKTAVEPGESFTVTADLSPNGDAPRVETVEVVLADETTDHRFELTNREGNRYSGTVTAPERTGDYRLYAGVRGTEMVRDTDEAELVSISDATALQVQTSDGETAGENTGGTGDATVTPTATPAPDGMPTSTSTPASDGTPSTTETQTSTPTSSTTESEDAEPTATGDAADGNRIFGFTEFSGFGLFEIGAVGTLSALLVLGIHLYRRL